MASWGQPLPAGWEAKWDAGQGRYFFINHMTKTTTWVDPRTQPQKQQRPPVSFTIPMEQPRSANGCSECGAKCTPGASKCSRCYLRQLVAEDVQETNIDASESEPELFEPDPVLMVTLTQEYPSANQSQITAALELADNVESRARRELERKGLTREEPLEQRVAKVYDSLRLQYTDCDESMLKRMIENSECDEEETKKLLSRVGYLTTKEKFEKERKEAKLAAKKKADGEARLKSEFPQMSHFEISCALEVADNDVETALEVLTMMKEEAEEKERAKSAASASRKAEKARGPSKESSPSKSTAKTQPASSSRGAKSTASSSSVSAASPPRTGSPARASPSVDEPSSRQSKPQSKPRAATRQNAAPTAIKPVHVSSRAHGPDRTLAKGAQDSLLQTKYLAVYGPDSSLARGASCNVAGPQGARGRDRSLAQGPMKGVHHEARFV